ncbi:hypothetical protein ACOMHN_049125 [Nucella lapillus]
MTSPSFQTPQVTAKVHDLSFIPDTKATHPSGSHSNMAAVIAESAAGCCVVAAVVVIVIVMAVCHRRKVGWHAAVSSAPSCLHGVTDPDLICWDGPLYRPTSHDSYDSDSLFPC